MKTETEIRTLLAKARRASDEMEQRNQSKWPNDTYEGGAEAVLLWILDQAPWDGSDADFTGSDPLDG